MQTKSGSIFGKVRVKVLAGQGQSTHEHVRTESLFCKQKTDFRFHFRFASSDGEATRDVQECFGGIPVALESQSDKVTLARKNVFLPWLALQGSVGGTDN